PAGPPDSAYQASVYAASLAAVGNTKTWSATPPTAGSSGMRLYSDGFARARTSPTFTVADPVPTLAVSPTTGPTGAEFTATVTNWTGAGWITIAPAGSPDSAYQAWVYVSSLATVGNTKTWKVTPPTAGSYEIRLYSDGFTRAGTSPAFTVSTAVPPQGSATVAGAPGSAVSATASGWRGAGRLSMAP